MARFYLRFDPVVLLVSHSDGFSYGSHDWASTEMVDCVQPIILLVRYRAVGPLSRSIQSEQNLQLCGKPAPTIECIPDIADCFAQNPSGY
ncbi:hypothetical protein EMIT0196MI5_130098 [Pseudomonas sp. IT-196MI5]